MSELPRGWTNARVGDVLELRYGKSLPKKHRISGDVTVYGSAGAVDMHNSPLVNAPSIVIGRKGSIGSIFLAQRPFWPIDTTYYVTPDPKNVDLRWLYHRLRALDLGSMNKSAAVPGLNRDDVYRLSMAFPPLDEQRRIAAILDATDSLAKSSDTRLSQFAGFEDSLHRNMFGTPEFPRNGATTMPFGDLLKVSSGKFLPSTAMNPSGPYPVYGGNGINGVHDDYALAEPTVVIGRVGAYCGAIHVTEPHSWVSDNALYVKSTAIPLAPDFLAASLRQANLNRHANQSGQPSISAKKLAKVPVLIAPEDAQREFRRRISVAAHTQAMGRQVHDRMSELAQALQSRAFRGEL